MDIFRLEKADVNDSDAMQALSRLYSRQGCEDKLRNLAWRMIQNGHQPEVHVGGQIVPVRRQKILGKDHLSFDLESPRICVSPIQVPLHWDARIARLFACDCAEHVLPVFETVYPNDTRPREAVAIARRFALGKATVEEVRIARTVVWDAVGDAVGDAVRDVAWAASWAAAEDAVAARAVRAAGGAAVRAAVRAAGGAGAAASMAIEIEWQRYRLLTYLLGQEV